MLFGLSKGRWLTGRKSLNGHLTLRHGCIALALMYPLKLPKTQLRWWKDWALIKMQWRFTGMTGTTWDFRRAIMTIFATMSPICGATGKNPKKEYVGLIRTIRSISLRERDSKVLYKRSRITESESSLT